MTPRFITLEGGEGVGKSTQVRALALALRQRGLTVLETREPGGSAGAESIRQLLLEGSADRWNVQSEALLFAAARADHVARVIRPALERGDWVICDRFVDSSRAYQGGGGGIADADIMMLHGFGSKGLMPDRSFLLSVDADESARRLQMRDGDSIDRMGAKPVSYHAKLAQRFAEIAAQEPERWRLIDAMGSPDIVSAAILAGIKDWLE